MNLRKWFGSRGERAARAHLKQKGMQILARGFACPLGELDLVAADGPTIVFVEVKTRASDALQDPQEAIRPVQRRRIERAARFFLTRHKLDRRPCRFDVVTVVWPKGAKPIIDHYEDAFQAKHA